MKKYTLLSLFLALLLVLPSEEGGVGVEFVSHAYLPSVMTFFNIAIPACIFDSSAA